MLKYISNKYILLLSVGFSSVVIALLYSLNNINLFVGNFFVVLATFIIQIISVGIFLNMSDAIINPKKAFKLRFFQTIKIILTSQLIMLPIGLILLLIYPCFHISTEWITKIIITATNYVVLLALFFSYPFVTKSDKYTTIKVVSSTIILMLVLRYISHFLI